MPSGYKIDWSVYDHVLRTGLPLITIEDWQQQHAPHISTKAIGARARKLGIKPAKYHPSSGLKAQIAKTLSKSDDEIVATIKEHRDSLSLRKLASKCGIGYTTLSRIIKENKILLSQEGIIRAKEASRTGSLGKKPWNKGIPLPDDVKVKMAIGRQAMSGRLSKLQAAFYRTLDENNINYLKEENPQCRFGHWLFDCRIIHNNHDFLVEVQGDYIHSQPKNISKDRAKATYMERYFPQIPVKYVWEHEFGATNRIKQKVRQWLYLDEIQQIDFSFKHLTFREIPEEETTTFLAAFHYLGKLAGRIRIGAFLGNTLMAVAVWGAPTRYETAERLGCTTRTCLELRRFVIHDAYHKKNCGTFLLARMEKMLPATVEVLVSFADPGVGHEGTLYRAANWQYDGDTTPSFYYIDDDGYVLLKKTLFNLANKMHMKERDYAETYGYEKIATPPKHRFIKKL